MYKNQDIPKRFDIENCMFEAELLKNVKTGKPHWHSHFLIALFKRNEGVQVLNNTEYHFEPGVAILMGPFDFHYNKIEGDETFDAYSIKFSHTFFYENLCELVSLENFPIVCKLEDDDFRIAEILCDNLIIEYNKERKNLIGHDIFVRNIIEQLVILILRNSKINYEMLTSNKNIRKALLYIHENFKNNISVDDVAEICHYTPNYFSTCFKNETGFTFQKYLLNLRLEFAYNLIKYTNKSCTEACFESGFNSIEYFSSAFKKKYNRSPSHFRQEL